MKSAKTLLMVVKAVSETIREVGETPAGTLYAALMQQGCTLQQFDSLIDILVRTKMVVRSGNMLRWIGPQLETK